MAAGAGYIEFTTGDILTATAANEYLASQVVMVFASASARTSAIASPQEGMMSYLKDTNSVEYYSGSAWVAVGGASSSGALTFIKKVDFTTSSSIDFSDSFSTTYDNYLIMGSFTATDNGDLNYRFRVGGSDNSTSNYNFQVVDIAGTGVAASRQTSQTAGRIVATRTGGERSSFSATFFNPFASKTKQYVGQGCLYTNSNFYVNNISGSFDATTSFTGMTIYPSGGTVTGTIRIFGISNS